MPSPRDDFPDEIFGQVSVQNNRPRCSHSRKLVAERLKENAVNWYGLGFLRYP